MSAYLCHCTCPDRDSAQHISHALVEERLAACVSVLPGVHSIYHWQGAIEQSEQVLLLIKTSAARLPALLERISQLHPYEVPEAVAVAVAAGNPAYLDWIEAETIAAPAPGGS